MRHKTGVPICGHKRGVEEYSTGSIVTRNVGLTSFVRDPGLGSEFERGTRPLDEGEGR